MVLELQLLQDHSGIAKKGKLGDKEPKDDGKKRQRFMSGEEEGPKKQGRKRHSSAEDMLKKRERPSSGERGKKRERMDSGDRGRKGERTVSSSGDEEKVKGKRKPKVTSPDRKKADQKSKYNLSQEGIYLSYIDLG